MSAVGNSLLSTFLIDIQLEVDGVNHTYPITSFKLSRTYNKASTLTLEIHGKESLEIFKIGSTVRMRGTRGAGEMEGQELSHKSLSGLDTHVKSLQFDGVVRVSRPKANSTVVTITDQLSVLATGAVREYKADDYVGEDLYYIAKDVLDTYNSDTTGSGDTLGFYDNNGGRWIDTSLLVQGSGILATREMDIWGFFRPKEFLDKLFGEMYKETDGATAKVNEYDSRKIFAPWRYNIFTGNTISFYYNDIDLKTPRVSFTVDEDNDYIIGEGIVAQIDTSRMINSCTIKSSEKLTLTTGEQETVSATFEDLNSIRKYGHMSSTFSIDSTEKDFLEEVARVVVQRNSQPSYTYAIKTISNEMFLPSDIVKLSAPNAGFEAILPVEQVDTVISNGSIETTLIVGERQLPVAELISALNR